MTDTRIDSVRAFDGTVRTFEARSYYDEEFKQHFALMPPGDDKLSRIAIPCSVQDLNEEQFVSLLGICNAVQSARRAGLVWNERRKPEHNG